MWRRDKYDYFKKENIDCFYNANGMFDSYCYYTKLEEYCFKFLYHFKDILDQ